MKVLSSPTTMQSIVMLCADDADYPPPQVTVPLGTTIIVILIPDAVFKCVEFDDLAKNGRAVCFKPLNSVTPDAGQGLLCTTDQVGKVTVNTTFRQPLSQFSWKRNVELTISVT